MLSSKVLDPVNCIHPIFYANLEYLEKVYAAWADGNLPEVRDQRLLFLALLNATDHIDWYCAADPKAETVAKYMEALFDHVLWMRNIMLPRLSLPRFAINHHTDAKTIPHCVTYCIAAADIHGGLHCFILALGSLIENMLDN